MGWGVCGLGESNLISVNEDECPPVKKKMIMRGSTCKVINKLKIGCTNVVLAITLSELATSYRLDSMCHILSYKTKND